MRTLGEILRSFFTTDKTQYWLRVPSSFESRQAKEDFIFSTIEFLNSKTQIDDTNS
jgi:hypothetical protein